jgi:hypothetical protein
MINDPGAQQAGFPSVCKITPSERNIKVSAWLGLTGSQLLIVPAIDFLSMAERYHLPSMLVKKAAEFTASMESFLQASNTAIAKGMYSNRFMFLTLIFPL